MYYEHCKAVTKKIKTTENNMIFIIHLLYRIQKVQDGFIIVNKFLTMNITKKRTLNITPVIVLLPNYEIMLTMT